MYLFQCKRTCVEIIDANRGVHAADSQKGSFSVIGHIDNSHGIASVSRDWLFLKAGDVISPA